MVQPESIAGMARSAIPLLIRFGFGLMPSVLAVLLILAWLYSNRCAALSFDGRDGVTDSSHAEWIASLVSGDRGMLPRKTSQPSANPSEGVKPLTS